MNQLFNDYISSLVLLTFDFKPQVRIDSPNEGVIKIYLDGAEDERKQMMGHHAQTFYAFKQLLMCFARRSGVYVYLYLEFQNDFNKTYTSLDERYDGEG